MHDDIAEAVSKAAARTAKPVLANFIATEETLPRVAGRSPRRALVRLSGVCSRAVARIADYGQWVARPGGDRRRLRRSRSGPRAGSWSRPWPCRRRRRPGTGHCAGYHSVRSCRTRFGSTRSRLSRCSEAYGIPILPCRRLVERRRGRAGRGRRGLSGRGEARRSGVSCTRAMLGASG